MATVQVTQVTVPPGWIDLGIGQPEVALLPLDRLAQAATHRFGLGQRDILQYGSMQGDSSFRAALARFLSEPYGQPVDPDHLFITGGISHTLDLICTLLTRPGDTIFVEEPSYFLALRIFADHKLKIISLPLDEDGLIIETLEAQLAGTRPAFLYTIPTFHNPAGVSLSAARRERLVALSQEYGFLILADEVYHLLAYTAAPPPPLASYDRSGQVLSLGSFSKILAPGLRLGWLQGQPDRLEPFITCGLLDSGGGLNPFVASLVNSMLELGLQAEYLAELRQVYGERMAVLSQALRRHLPALTFTGPAGGYFIWAQLPPGEAATSVLARAAAQRVSFQPGIKFSSQQGLPYHLRFSFAYYGPAELQEGVRRLAQVIR